jgi:hypothetical protein
MLTPVEATTAGSPASKPAGLEPVAPGIARLEIDGHEPQPFRNAEAEFDQTLPLPGLRTPPVDLEYP